MGEELHYVFETPDTTQKLYYLANRMKLRKLQYLLKCLSTVSDFWRKIICTVFLSIVDQFIIIKVHFRCLYQYRLVSASVEFFSAFERREGLIKYKEDTNLDGRCAAGIQRTGCCNDNHPIRQRCQHLTQMRIKKCGLLLVLAKSCH